MAPIRNGKHNLPPASEVYSSPRPLFPGDREHGSNGAAGTNPGGKYKAGDPTIKHYITRALAASTALLALPAYSENHNPHPEEGDPVDIDASESECSQSDVETTL